MDAGVNAWFDEEPAGSTFADERLGKRLRQLVERLSGAMGASIPLACQDWANTKAAYRFFANDRVSEGEILAGHFQATRSRFASTPGLFWSCRIRVNSSIVSIRRRLLRDIALDYSATSLVTRGADRRMGVARP
ncbi:IS4/Tn5 family transposase DNA-binding protein [Ensifer sp. SL37]|uniref:IS4/Tn5 family transposase DNA-binding protein n=1 Tax=Ensifer sp. SL37 TaxID=2995137 RepID=UPI00227272D8|nr:transposase DNA-binding-containing protein [Ensifer sp. SL37]MCY1740681.1 transposase DNA-binding-containing protein [Ensifer sp. SL37]